MVLKEHKAAIKALAWCPWNNGLLVTGGGKQDGTIKFWNAFSGANTKCIDTESQISGLLWSAHNRELVSSHGDPHNKLSIWKFPNFNKVGDLIGHSERVLSIVMSPNGETVASLAADETLRFWECFKTFQSYKSVYSTPVTTGRLNFYNIR